MVLRIWILYTVLDSKSILLQIRKYGETLVIDTYKYFQLCQDERKGPQETSARIPGLNIPISRFAIRSWPHKIIYLISYSNTTLLQLYYIY